MYEGGEVKRGRVGKLKGPYLCSMYRYDIFIELIGLEKGCVCWDWVGVGFLFLNYMYIYVLYVCTYIYYCSIIRINK